MQFPRFKDVREDNDITQKEIADLLETTESYYNRLENGKHEITLSRALKLAIKYNVSLDYLTGRTNVKEIAPERPAGAQPTRNGTKIRKK